MSVIEATIEVDAPLRATYDQWTQFEDFPRFMEGIEEVRQLEDTRLHWVARIAGVQREWEARITEQIPDQLVAWTSVEGTRNDGVVTFEPVAAARTRVMLRLDIEPDGAIEKVGDALGVIESRARADLDRFKEFIESRGEATGAWRGEVDSGRTVGDDSSPGEVPASTGGMVDLDRIVGNIPVVLVFLDPLFDASSNEVLRGIGEHLADFGRDRIQVLAVARVDAATAGEAESGVAGNARILADEDGSLAHHYDVEYRPLRPTTVLIGADGHVAATWIDTSDANFAEDLLARLAVMAA